ncbi:MAG: hypothetical protein ACREH8_12930 [Opitutaceae bacterium]
MTKAGVEIATDEGRNLLRIRFHGDITVPGMKAAFDEIKVQLGHVSPGFTILTDLSDLESMELDCVDSLTRMMECFKSAGIGLVVRVIPDPSKDIGFNILSRTHYRRGVKVITCETLAAAERALPNA